MKKLFSNFTPWYIFFFYSIASLGLFLYSWTQVDLGLTLTQFSVWQTVQKAFQHVGYFERGISVILYIVIVFSLFILYGLVLRLIEKEKIQKKSLFFLIGINFCFLILSYPAFSYDLFNHIFTAKTVLVYHKNPYEVIPLQFTGYEQWLSFLHWTHVVSVFSPLWIALTTIPYLLGFGYFLLILWNFKVFIGVFYLLSCYFIWIMLKKTDKKTQLLGLAFFSLNPLVLIESLVSGHNDISMIAFALGALYFLAQGQKLWAFGLLSISIAFKQVTMALLPLFFVFRRDFMPVLCMIFMLTTFLFVFQREIMPWYFLWIIPFTVQYVKKGWVVILVSAVSLGLLFRYAPYLYYGHWNDPVPTLKFWVTVTPVAFGFAAIFLSMILPRIIKKLLL